MWALGENAPKQGASEVVTRLVGSLSCLCGLQPGIRPYDLNPRPLVRCHHELQVTQAHQRLEAELATARQRESKLEEELTGLTGGLNLLAGLRCIV